MDTHFNALHAGELDIKARQARYEKVVDFFQSKADAYDSRIEVGNAIWQEEQK